MKRYIFTSDDGAVLVSGSSEDGQPGLISPDGMMFFEVEYQPDPEAKVEFLEHQGFWKTPHMCAPQLLRQVGTTIWTYSRKFTFRPEGTKGLPGHDDIIIIRLNGEIEGGRLADMVRIPQPVGE